MSSDLRKLLIAFAAAISVWGFTEVQAKDVPDGRASAPASDTAKTAQGIFRRFGGDQRSMRFEGETAARVWSIYVTAPQAATRARLRVKYSSAVSVMPEASTLQVFVNDVPVAHTAIAAFADVGQLEADVPKGLLRTGFNAVRFAVEQRHRVDCSPEATYELWTQLDPGGTGLVFPAVEDQAVVSLDDLASMSPDPSGANTIKLVLPPDAGAATVDRAMRAVQALALRGNFIRPSVQIADRVEDKQGLYLVVGTTTELAERGWDHYVSEASAVSIGGGDVEGRAIVVVSGMDDRQVEASIQQLAQVHRPDDRTSASAALAWSAQGGVRISGGETYTLQRLGVRTQEFNGRLFRSEFDVVLPPDFYAADYDKLTLLVEGAYAAGLNSNSRLVVRVNDNEAASLPLRNPAGDRLNRRQLTVSLKSLRPGFNRFVIEAFTPNQADKECDIHALMDSGRRFVLSDKSELVVPTIARIAEMPNLAITAASGFPYAGHDGGKMFIARPTKDVLAAAGTLMARLAIGARRPLHLRVTFDRNDLASGSALLVGVMSDFSEQILDRFGLDVAAIQERWSAPSGPDASGPKPDAVDPAALEASEPSENWNEVEHTGSKPSQSWRESLRLAYERYVNVRKSDFVLLRKPDQRFNPPEKSRLVFAQARGPGGGRDTWTIAVASDDKALADDMKEVTGPSPWGSIEGRAAAFDPKTQDVAVRYQAGAYFIETAAPTPGNIRLVAAGWLSSNLDFYLFGLVGLALVLGAATAATVKIYGVRT